MFPGLLIPVCAERSVRRTSCRCSVLCTCVTEFETNDKEMLKQRRTPTQYGKETNDIFLKHDPPGRRQIYIPWCQ